MAFVSMLSDGVLPLDVIAMEICTITLCFLQIAMPTKIKNIKNIWFFANLREVQPMLKKMHRLIR